MHARNMNTRFGRFFVNPTLHPLRLLTAAAGGRGGGAYSRHAWPSSHANLAPAQCRDGARHVFTDQENIAGTKRDPP